MGADRDPVGGEPPHGFHEGCAPFQLDHLGAALAHQTAGTGQGQIGGGVGQEGHVHQDERLAAGPCHTGTVIDHVIQGHRHRGFLALDHHTEGIAH